MRIGRFYLAIASLLYGCGPKPGTYVEIVNSGGKPAYVAGAAGPGMSYGTACDAALTRAVAALAEKFADENDDLADDIAKAVGASDGAPFLQGFAKADAQNAVILGRDFDPVDHLCMATVRWTPPLFVKDAVLAYAQALKDKELGRSQPPRSTESAPPARSAPSSAAPPPAPAWAPGASSSAPPAVSAAPPASTTAAPPPPQVPACDAEHRAFVAQTAASFKLERDLAECLRRTKDDATVCHRYKLHVEESRKKDDAVAEELALCKNKALAPRLRERLGRQLSGAAAVALETRADGSVLVWAYRLLDGTGVAVEVSPSGSLGTPAPLAENQIEWVRDQLGL